MQRFKKVRKFDLASLYKVASILNQCGKYMSRKYGLHHWDNPFLKTFLIASFCIIKNDVFLLYDDNHVPVATFQTRRIGSTLHFEKLGTIPIESGKGYGSTCMNKIEDLAIEEHCSNITMEVYKPSEHAIEFYQKRGYRIVGETDTLKYKEVKMEKEI